MKPSGPRRFGATGKQPCVSNLTRGFATAMLDGKAHHRRDAISRALQRFERFGQTKPERADYASGGNCHAGWSLRGSFFT
jgi:hypothetical protein